MPAEECSLRMLHEGLMSLHNLAVTEGFTDQDEQKDIEYVTKTPKMESNCNFLYIIVSNTYIYVKQDILFQKKEKHMGYLYGA